MWNLILHNLKKTKGQFISFGIVMLITAVILNTAFVLLFQTEKAYDALFDQLNTADISVTIPSILSSDEILTDISNLNNVSETDENEALFASAALQDFQDSEFTMNTYFYHLGDERSLNLHSVSDLSGSTEEMRIYIPLYLSELGGYKVGDTIRYIIDGKEYSFVVDGIVNEMQYGNYGTGFIGMYLSDEAYNALKDDKNFTQVTEYVVKTDDETKLTETKNALAKLLKDKNIATLSVLDRETTKESRTMVSSTIVLFLAVFALLVLIVSIFLARFKIKNTIDEEINEMGVLKGIGYTSRMLRLSHVIPYVLVCGVGLILGVGLSYLLIPVVANVLAVQSGFSYDPVFDLTAACITIISILLIVLIFTVLASTKIKRLEPINAIRGIDPQKSVQKNYFPLDTSKGPIGLNLILKQANESFGRNVLLFAVTFVMMILLTFTGVLLYNVNVRPDNFLSTLSEELPDIRIQSDSEHIAELKDILKSKDIGVVNYGISNAEYSDGSLPLIVTEDFSLLKNDILYVGEHPDTADEIAIGSALADDYDIGDTFTLKQNETEHTYTVTGFIQSVNNNGLIAEVTDSGYAYLSDTPLNSLNLYVDEGTDISGLVDELETDYDDYIISINNSAKDMESMQILYSSLITIVAAVLFIITILIVLLFLYVILQSMITNLKTDFGIYKAMGFTSRQLILRTVGSITPVILFASVLSAVLGILYLPAMFDGVFSVIGAMKNNFEIPFMILLGIAVILTVVNIIIGIALCLKIRKITAYSLIKE